VLAMKGCFSWDLRHEACCRPVRKQNVRRTTVAYIDEPAKTKVLKTRISKKDLKSHYYTEINVAMCASSLRSTL